MNVYFNRQYLNKYINYSKNDIYKFWDYNNIKHNIEDKIYNRYDYIDNLKQFTLNRNLLYTTSNSSGRSFPFYINTNIQSLKNYYVINKILHFYNLEYEDLFFVYIEPDRKLKYDLSYTFFTNHILSKCLSVRYTSLDLLNNLLDIDNIVLISSPSIYDKMIDNNINLDFNIKLCISSLEHLYKKNKIENYFGCKCVDWITCFDGNFSAWQCPYGQYHIDFECAIVENIDEKIILTDLTSPSTIFYRYHNGDMGKINYNKECECGNHSFILEDFYGRETEIFYHPKNNKKIYGMEIYDTLFAGIDIDCFLLQKENKDIIIYFNTEDNIPLRKIRERMNCLFDQYWEIKKIKNVYNIRQSDKKIKMRSLYEI